MKVLIVVDMQNDFIDGVLGTREAVAIVPHVKDRGVSCRKKDGDLYERYPRRGLSADTGRTKTSGGALHSRKPWMENIIETGYGGQ